MRVWVLALGAMACVAEPERPDRDAPYHDFDGDGFTEDEGDCDDGDEAVSPDGVESCNEIDDDCDEAIDESTDDGPTWYADADADGFGDATDAGVVACSAPEGRVADRTDCDDTPGSGASRYPGNPSPVVGDGIDGDCDGTGRDECYADADEDGFGGAAIVQDTGAMGCVTLEGEAGVAGDCAESDPAVNPDGADSCAVDRDCDGAPAPSGTEGCPAASCAQILAAADEAASGTWWVDPSGTAPFSVYCDMEGHGGGWTLVARIVATSDAHRDAAAVGTLTGPAQSTPAKLADPVIDALRGTLATSVVRFDCGPSTVFFQEDKAFGANLDGAGALLRTATDPAGTWTNAVAYNHHFGVNTYSAPGPYVIYSYTGSTDTDLGCFSDQTGESDGALWVR